LVYRLPQYFGWVDEPFLSAIKYTELTKLVRQKYTQHSY